VSEAVGDYVVPFDGADGSDARLLGGKGAGLVRMAELGLPVPPGFIVTCRAGAEYLGSMQIPPIALGAIRHHLASLEHRVGRRFGDGLRPLLVSVRSGAPVSMPGMMDTVLNVGLTSRTVQALAAETRDSAFAWDCYARFAEGYARIVRAVSSDRVEGALLDLELSGVSGEARARATVERMQDLMIEDDGSAIPDDPAEQIMETVEAVFRSWNSPRAVAYRRFRAIDDSLGTAAVVQAMVFGNRGITSGSGVAFTRNPSTGEPSAYGDFLFDAQGEDVVAGARDPDQLSELGGRLPATLAELERALAVIERDTRDLCEVEFTVEDGHFWVLQTRVAQRSGQAAVRAAVDLVEEAAISKAEAVRRVTPSQAEAAASPVFVGTVETVDVVMKGQGASPGAAVGRVVFDIADAVASSESGEDVILVRPTTSPSDVAGFIAAAGIVTGRGGRTSHAAVVARGMGRPAVCGVGDVQIARDGSNANVAGIVVERGSLVSLDGTSGIVAAGVLARGPGPGAPLLNRLLGWCADLVEVPIDHEPAGLPVTPDESTLLLDDPEARSVDAANKALADANAAGLAPTVLVSRRWASAAGKPLKGTCRRLGCSDEVVSLPLLALDLKPASDA
jgi:pyruvate,orthophosphate dikinase